MTNPDIAICTKCGTPTWETRCSQCRDPNFDWKKSATLLLGMVESGDHGVLRPEAIDLARAILADMREKGER
jgi:hypothetical protein